MIALEYCCTCGPAISLPAGFTISETVVLLMFGMLFYRPKIMGSENRKQTGFPFIVQKPANSAVDSDESLLYAAYTGKTGFFAHST